MPFYGQNGQRNDGLYFVMTSSSWTLIVLAYQMKNPLTGQSAAHRARYETDMVGSSVTAVHFLSFRCLQSFAGLSKGGYCFLVVPFCSKQERFVYCLSQNSMRCRWILPLLNPFPAAGCYFSLENGKRRIYHGRQRICFNH